MDITIEDIFNNFKKNLYELNFPKDIIENCFTKECIDVNIKTIDLCCFYCCVLRTNAVFNGIKKCIDTNHYDIKEKSLKLHHYDIDNVIIRCECNDEYKNVKRRSHFKTYLKIKCGKCEKKYFCYDKTSNRCDKNDCKQKAIFINDVVGLNACSQKHCRYLEKENCIDRRWWNIIIKNPLIDKYHKYDSRRMHMHKR